MSGTDLRAAEHRIANAERELARARRALEAVRASDIPPEPHLPYITFWLRHGDRRYTYAAIDANGRWYTTGSTCPARGYTWRQLVEWMRQADGAGPIRQLTETGSTFEVTV